MIYSANNLFFLLSTLNLKPDEWLLESKFFVGMFTDEKPIDNGNFLYA